jgi:hypothetical protein
MSCSPGHKQIRLADDHLNPWSRGVGGDQQDECDAPKPDSMIKAMRLSLI